MKKQKENPFISILFNLVLPVIFLKNGNKWIGIENKLFGIETSMLVLIIALSFPTIYFINDFRLKSHANFVSILGFVNVLLTGLIGIMGEQYGISRIWFILKESIIPLIIGLVILISMNSKRPLVKTLIFNSTIFNISKIENKLTQDDKIIFDSIFRSSTFYIGGSFFMSSIIQFFLASYIVTVDPGNIEFNNQVGTMTWVSYFVVMVPCLSMFGYALWKIINGLKLLTGMNTDEILNN